jgi:hypothetical protein
MRGYQPIFEMYRESKNLQGGSRLPCPFRSTINANTMCINNILMYDNMNKTYTLHE